MAATPSGLRWRSHPSFILSTVGIGIFTDLFLYSLIVPILPFMLHDRLHLPRSVVQQHVSGLLSAYAAAMLFAAPITGIVADRLQMRQAPYLAGLLTLCAATALLYSSTMLPVMYAARALQGVSAAIVWTVGIALCVDTVGLSNLGKTLGTMSSATLAGVALAPIVGGALYQCTGVLGPVVLSMSLIAVDLLMRLLVLEKTVAATFEQAVDEACDTDGALDESSPARTAVNAQATAEDQSQRVDDESQPLLQNNEYKLATSKPSWIVRLMPILPCLGNSRLLMALLLTTTQSMILGAFEATIPIHSAALFGFESFKAGLVMMSVAIPSVVCGPLLGYAVDKYGPKLVATSTLVLQACMLMLLRLPRAGGADQIALYAITTALCSISISGCSSASAVESGLVVNAFHKANPTHFGALGPYAQLYALNSMAYTLGLGIGPEITGQLQPVMGFGNTFIVLAVVSALTGVLTVLYVGESSNKPIVEG
ncbi:uncharacterized protein HMPREF1541_11083 [Cyphellophora europaea CBS 101466]|uniref:Major facilitator superfamily (MFS) profile domain-containing protein n=1 Tax=Cyphellophora europaea (strain CBS 101466) TaxID=1220924 RepID=W2S5J6_CYPE1|nr:uncharacterized protein HMPREF1541_11083 [Cyphellophora europaea CBS 101466]ETN43952.1 hypothetical protein HMPREF1541_11083 [Cyphellophora europaea CBS 101466]